MRRYISLACVSLVVIMCMVSPVSAADFSLDYMDLLDFNEVITNQYNEGNFFHFQGSHTISIDFPFQCYSYYVDMVFVSNGGSPSVTCISNSRSYPLTVVSVGSNIYRAYGDIGDYNNTSLSFIFSSSSHCYVTINSCRIRTTDVTYFDSDCYCNIGTVDYDATIHYVSTDEINSRSFSGSDDFLLANYSLYIYNLNWKKYDFVDYMIYSKVDSVSTINCTMGGVSVPYEISFISNDAMLAHDFVYSIRVDCRGLDRSSDDYPMVIVQGNVITSEVNVVSVLSCNGLIYDSIDVHGNLLQRIFNLISSSFNSLGLLISNQTSSILSGFDMLQDELNIHFTNVVKNQNSIISSISTHFTTLFSELRIHFNNVVIEINNIRKDMNDKFNSLNQWILTQTSVLEAAIRGDTAPGDSFQQEVDKKDQELNDMAAVMDSVSKPQIDSVNVSADTYVDQTVLATSMSGLTAVISMPVFQNVIMMSLIMATAGYVLFGKR